VVVVRPRTCLGCGRTLKRGKAVRCRRCRAARERESDALRKREQLPRRDVPRAPTPAVREVPSVPPETPFRDRETDCPIPVEEVLEHYRDRANWPADGSTELRALEDFTERLSGAGDPRAPAFLALFPDETEPARAGPAAPTPVVRRLEIPASDLNVLDLLVFARDPSWDLEDRRRMAAELRRRQEDCPEMREAIDRVLAAFPSSF
jgi:hypothetical protein